MVEGVQDAIPGAQEAHLARHARLLGEPGAGSQLTKGDAEQAKTAKFELGDTTVVITDDGRIVEPGSGERGRLANRGVVPLGYFKDDKKTAETFPTINGVRYSIPGDYATVETDGTITLPAADRSASTPAARRSIPRRSRRR